ncbi:hypothetical protein Tco_0768579 [Tanacetum coccineum]
MTHPSPKRNMVPKAVLMRSGLVSLTTARPVNTAQPRTTVNSARPMTNFNKAHSTVKRPIHKKTIFKNSNFNQRVNTVKNKNVNTVRQKAVVNTAKPKAVLNVVKGNQVNAVKASACWVWKPKTNGNPQQDLQEKGVIDSGCSRHMTGNMSYLTNFKKLMEDMLPLEVTPKDGKSQAELSDESHVLLKVPRKNNMYSVDLKNIVPKRDHLGKFDGKADEGFFVGYSIKSKAFKNPPFSQSSKSSPDAGFKPSGDDEKKVTEEPGKEGGDSINVVGGNSSIELPDDPNMPKLEDIIYSDNDEDVGAEDDMNNLDTFMPVSPIPTIRVHKDHPVEQIIGDLNSTPQTRRMTKNLEEHGLFSSVQQRTNHKVFQNCLFTYFLSQDEPKKVIQALKDSIWIEAMQEELLQFKLQEVWTLVELPNGKRAIRSKWVFKNKKDEREIVIKNKEKGLTMIKSLPLLPELKQLGYS